MFNSIQTCHFVRARCECVDITLASHLYHNRFIAATVRAVLLCCFVYTPMLFIVSLVYSVAVGASSAAALSTIAMILQQTDRIDYYVSGIDDKEYLARRRFIDYGWCHV